MLRTMDTTARPDLSSLSAEELAGQLLVVGYAGAAPNDALVDAHRRGLLGGFIVFKRNLVAEGTARIDALAATLAHLAETAPPGLPPLLAVDQEGGRVARLGAPLLALPPMRALAAVGDVDLVRRAGRALGEELRAVGFTMDFAPVLDVDSNPANPIIGDRAFSSSARETARFALAFADGLADGGLLSCGKHFPGHGDTAQDSHLELPTVDKTRAALDETELVPFRLAAAQKLPSLMSAHVVFPALAKGPATLERAVATDLLRDELGYEGVLFSDDLEMKALSQDIEVTAVSAIEAGCDVLLVCSDEAKVARARQALAAKIRELPAFRARVLVALARFVAMRSSCPPRPSSSAARGELFASHADLTAEIARRTAEVRP